MDEELKKQLINDAGTFVIVPEILTDSKTLADIDNADVPWTAKQVIDYNLNQ